MPDYLGDTPTKEPLVRWHPSTHPLNPKLPLPFINPRWQRHFSDQVTEIQKKPTRQASVLRSAQGAAIATTALPIGSVRIGLWHVSYYVQIVTVAGVSSSVTVTFAWTYKGAAITNTFTAVTGNTLTSWGSAVLPIRVDADTPISYSTAYASNPAGAMRYDLQVVAVEVAPDVVAA